MKKLIFLIIPLLSLFTSCEKNEEPPVITQIDYIGFESGLTVELDPTETKTYEIEVATSYKTTGNRTFFLKVSKETNANPLAYSIPKSVTVLANKNIGTFNVDIKGEYINTLGKDTLAIGFVNSSESTIYSNPIILKLKPKCKNPKLSIYITFDENPEEVYWRILDNNNNIVLESAKSENNNPTYGAYSNQTNGSNLFLSECLDSGTYTFEIYDGRDDGAGPFDLSLGNTTIFSSKGDYGSLTSTTFTIP